MPFSQERNSPSKSENVRQSFEKVSYYARPTFCIHRESPDNFNFFELLISSPKIAFDELFLKPILETSGNIYFFENFRKSDRAAEVPIFECKLYTKAQHRRILQKSPIRFGLLTKPSLSFFYMWHMINYPYLSNWPFLTAFNYHWGMPRPMIKNSQFLRQIKYFWYFSFCQSYFLKSNMSQHAYRVYQTLTRKASDRENLQRPHHFRSTVRKKNSDGQVNFTSLHFSFIVLPHTI